MKERDLLQAVTERVEQRRFAEAEELLLEARNNVLKNRNPAMMDFVFSELISLYCIMEPPNLARAEELSLEWESLDLSPRSKLQTGMFFYWSAHDPSRAVPKLREAIDEGERVGDSGTVYSSLALSGLALLDLKRADDAATVLDRLELMITGRLALVPGDETLFLERGLGAGLDASQIKRIASLLVPICREPAFAKRLRQLAYNS